MTTCRRSIESGLVVHSPHIYAWLTVFYRARFVTHGTANDGAPALKHSIWPLDFKLNTLGRSETETSTTYDEIRYKFARDEQKLIDNAKNVHRK